MNKHIVIGNVGQLPEINATETTTIANFSIATNRFRKDKTTQETIQETDWINCVAFGKTAELIGSYVKKGSKVAVVGTVRTSSWENEQGEKKYKTETFVHEIEFLSSKENNSQEPPTGMSEPKDDLPF